MARAETVIALRDPSRAGGEIQRVGDDEAATRVRARKTMQETGVLVFVLLKGGKESAKR